MANDLTPAEQAFLAEAAQYLEQPSLLMRLAATVGKPIEVLGRFAPQVVHQTAQATLERVLALAIATVPEPERKYAAADDPNALIVAELVESDPRRIGARSSFWHSLAVVASGAGGGALGLPGLAIELPVTTALIFRSIAAIAQESGEYLGDPRVKLECLSVFSYSGSPPAMSGADTSALESSYLTVRFGLQETLVQASSLVAKLSAEELTALLRSGSAPVLVQLMSRIAGRFNIAVSQKFLAQSLPVVGAAAGAAVNVAFLDHFNRVARYHFGIRRLERIYGPERVHELYRTPLIARPD